jgi:hypothetical protein
MISSCSGLYLPKLHHLMYFWETGASRGWPGLVKPMFTGPSLSVNLPLYKTNRPYKPENLLVWLPGPLFKTGSRFDTARLEIISVRVSERHVAEKFRYHIGNTDTTSVFSDTTSEIPTPHRFFSTPRKYRYHIGFFRHLGNTDVVSEKTDVVSVFPMWYRNFSATCLSNTRTEIISNRGNSFKDI